MNERIELKKFMLIIKQNIIWMILIIAISVIAMFVYLNYFTTPIYQKNVQILVNQTEKAQKSSLEAQTVQADLQLVNTYSTIVSSPRILNKVKQNLGEPYNTEDLAKMIQVKNATNSQVIEIIVNHFSPRIAAQIANLTAKTFAAEIPKIMKIDNVTIISEANYLESEAPIKPQKAFMLVLALFLGILLAIIFTGAKLFFTRTFTSAEEIEKLLNLPVLGEVSMFRSDFSHERKV